MQRKALGQESVKCLKTAVFCLTFVTNVSQCNGIFMLYVQDLERDDLFYVALVFHLKNELVKISFFSY